MHNTIKVEFDGNLVGLTPDQLGREWLEANCEIEAWQWLGGTLWIDYRAASYVLAKAREDGISVSRA